VEHGAPLPRRAADATVDRGRDLAAQRDRVEHDLGDLRAALSPDERFRARAKAVKPAPPRTR
jgi:hypothetical protein